MEEADGGSSSTTGYGEPPWKFKGRGVYQLHLVKSEVARAFIPNDFRLVQAFGYTLGGFFLANYDASPAGPFDELVVIAGIVWNPPTSCAWASKVLVNSNEACLHGRKHVGLPSGIAKFTTLPVRCCPEQRITAKMRQQDRRPNTLLNMVGLSSTRSSSRFHLDNEVTEISGSPISSADDDILNISLLSTVPKKHSEAWLGLPIKMSLPSFSGRTEYNPYLLKYSCQMECRVRVVQPLQISKVLTPTPEEEGGIVDTTEKQSCLSLSVMLSKPILALEFNCLNMNVEAPVVISQ